MDRQEGVVEPAPTAAKPRVLISGASFAGLASAWWLQRIGYRVTVVEIAEGLRKGGTPVDIRDQVIDVVRAMGLVDRIEASALPPRFIDFLKPDGSLVTRIPAQRTSDDGAPHWEIERDTLLELLFEETQQDTEFLFGDSIVEIDERPEEVRVQLASGRKDSYSLLLGCDGTHSAVRRLCFGEESAFVVDFGIYFALSIVRTLLIEENTSKMVNEPGKTIGLNAYNGKTDIVFIFTSDADIPYGRRNQDVQKQAVMDIFGQDGWRSQELLDGMMRADNFYFDKLCQVRMNQWCKGRVALVGDAGYCPSPAAGFGGSIALLGAAALAHALARYPDSLAEAFNDYDERLRPLVESIQDEAVKTAREMVSTVTEQDIRAETQL